MSRMVGTTSRGLRAPIIKQGDDIVDIVVNTVLDASADAGFEIHDKDIVAMTEAIVARAQGNYATVDDIAADVKAKFGGETVGVIFPILSRNRFAICLRGIAKGAKKIVLMLSYPSDEVGNHLISLDQLDEKGINPYTDVLTLKEYRELFGYEKHRFTGVDYVEYYEQLITESGAECEIIFANDARAILKYTKNVLNCDIHSRFRTKRLLKAAGVEISYGIDEILTSSVNGSGYNPDYGLLGSNKATEDTVKLFPKDCQPVVDAIQAKLYEKTGIMFNTFNTVYQLYDDLLTGKLEGATDFLMLPEYFSYLLTGVKKKEYTNATTTGLVNADARRFDLELTDALGLPRVLFEGELSEPGTSLGNLLPEIAAEVGGNTEVILCASHDTASAVEGIPMSADAKAPYISSGTWSLLGVKVPAPITNEKALAVNFSNEGGVGYIRFQKNIMGLWIVQSLRRELCPEKGFDLIEREAGTSTFQGTFNVNDESFLAPKSMKAAIDNAFPEGERPERECDYFYSAFRSLALSYREAILELQSLTGENYDALYIVGGGAKNLLLNQLTEEAIGFPVIALPIEATALGNLKIQMNRK